MTRPIMKVMTISPNSVINTLLRIPVRFLRLFFTPWRSCIGMRIGQDAETHSGNILAAGSCGNGLKHHDKRTIVHEFALQILIEFDALC